LKKLETEAVNATLETEEGLEYDFLGEAPERLIPRLQTVFRDNLNDIILLIVLTSLMAINFVIEAKLESLNFFFVVILAAGYSLGKRFAVLTAFLTILIVWAFILSDNTPFLIHYNNDSLNFYMTLWGGFLILTGWLGSAFENNKGFTLIELLTVIGIIGVLAAIAIPVFNQYKGRSLDADAKSNLHNIYLACKGYWTENGSGNSCTVPIAKSTAYGYMQSSDVSIGASGDETTFSGTGSHVISANTWTINSIGSIN